mmetsp:Transcript_2795/g.7234  ORF Transcript_2795/g.7234 Transcript_2795/m.7234 type:complete len:208 (-) Transcript_2795:3495-4118(-)
MGPLPTLGGGSRSCPARACCLYTGGHGQRPGEALRAAVGLGRKLVRRIRRERRAARYPHGGGRGAAWPQPAMAVFGHCCALPSSCFALAPTACRLCRLRAHPLERPGRGVRRVRGLALDAAPARPLGTAFLGSFGVGLLDRQRLLTLLLSDGRVTHVELCLQLIQLLHPHLGHRLLLQRVKLGYLQVVLPHQLVDLLRSERGDGHAD